jgi:hypothetical protein
MVDEDTWKKEKTHSPTDELITEHRCNDTTDVRERNMYSKTFCSIREVMIWI